MVIQKRTESAEMQAAMRKLVRADRRDVATYTARTLFELREMALELKLWKLVYFLDMAFYQAYEEAGGKL